MILVAACSMALPAWAQTPPTSHVAAATADSASQPSNDPDRMVCRYERPTGSKIPTKTCKTAGMWEYESQQSRKMVQDAQQRTGQTR
ncbi:hypothetical protein [Ideonella alba]|nr:hypothetical protein [Ideonella alba]